MIDSSYFNKLLLRAAMRQLRVSDSSEIYVSEASSPCLRMHYYNRTVKRLPSPSEALKTLGSEAHRLLQEELRLEGWDVEVSIEKPLDGFVLKGRVDALKDNVVLELKTVNGLPSQPYDSHVMQLQAYLALMHARKGFLVYMDRASGRISVFKVKPDPRTMKHLVERARKLFHSLKHHSPPEREMGAWCAYCNHKLRCFTNVEGTGKR